MTNREPRPRDKNGANVRKIKKETKCIDVSLKILNGYLFLYVFRDIHKKLTPRDFWPLLVFSLLVTLLLVLVTPNRSDAAWLKPLVVSKCNESFNQMKRKFKLNDYMFPLLCSVHFTDPN